MDVNDILQYNQVIGKEQLDWCLPTQLDIIKAGVGGQMANYTVTY
jgi:hypothetical protein